MIIQDLGASQLLITQPDHAALAGRIMRHWTADHLPQSPRRADILLAITEHDNGWREVDATPIVDPATGALLDFVHAPDDVRQGVWPRGVGRLSHVPYAAALVAQHASHIYSRYRTTAGWSSFFVEMDRLRDRHLRATTASLTELQRDYLLVRIADLISLTFCAQWRDEQSDGTGRTVRLVDCSRVTVAPDPFGGRIVTFEVPATEVPAGAYDSPGAAIEAIRTGASRTLTGIAVGTS
jgi:hypothetical protein